MSAFAGKQTFRTVKLKGGVVGRGIAISSTLLVADKVI